MKQLPNPFALYEFSQEEAEAGLAFNDLQRAALQNLLTQHALQKLQLKVDTTNTMAFVQQEAYQAGCIATLNMLLNPPKVTEVTEEGVE